MIIRDVLKMRKDRGRNYGDKTEMEKKMGNKKGNGDTVGRESRRRWTASTKRCSLLWAHVCPSNSFPRFLLMLQLHQFGA